MTKYRSLVSLYVSFRALPIHYRDPSLKNYAIVSALEIVEILGNSLLSRLLVPIRLENILPNRKWHPEGKTHSQRLLPEH